MKNISKSIFFRYFLVQIFFIILSTGCTKTVIQKVERVSIPATVSAKTIFFDDFSSSSQATTRNMWLNNGKAHWVWQGKTSVSSGCTDGCLKQNSEDARALNAIMYVSTPAVSNATIETKTRINYDMSITLTDNDIKNIKKFIGTGIVFRMKDQNNYYMFRLAGEEGCVLGKMVNGRWIDLENPRRLNFLEGGRIKPNNWYTLKVKVIGNNIQCYINDSTIINYTDYDSNFTVGSFGLVTFKCFADFEYIRVTE